MDPRNHRSVKESSKLHYCTSFPGSACMKGNAKYLMSVGHGDVAAFGLPRVLIFNQGPAWVLAEAWLSPSPAVRGMLAAKILLLRV